MMINSVDGFPVRDSINFLPDKPDVSINQWSYSKMTKVVVLDFYFNPRTIKWKGKTQRVLDYELFEMMIKGWIAGDKNLHGSGMTKEAALDLSFEIDEYNTSKGIL